jgi:lysophospholipase L1-like esterase
MRHLALILLSVSTLPALAQTPAPANTLSASDPAVQQAFQSIEGLERYREANVPTLMNDYGQLGRYRAANAALGAPKAGEQRVVFFGDSITDMWKLDESFPGKHYINRGIGGQTTRQMMLRFREDVVDLSPAVVLILAGTNDIAGNTGAETLEEIEANYANMAEIARANGIRVIFESVTPIHDYTPRATSLFLQRSPEKILALDAWLKSYCAEHHLIYLDYFSAMVDGRGWMKADLSDDGLHPNADGFAVMAPLAEAAIERALAEPGAGRTGERGFAAR